MAAGKNGKHSEVRKVRSYQIGALIDFGYMNESSMVSGKVKKMSVKESKGKLPKIAKKCQNGFQSGRIALISYFPNLTHDLLALE